MGVEALHPDVGAIDDRLAARFEHLARRGDRRRRRPETRLDAALERINVAGSAQQVVQGHGLFRPRDAKADAIVEMVGSGRCPGGRAYGSRGTVPGAAAHDPRVTRRGTAAGQRTAVSRPIAHTVMKTVFDPLRDVAVHVVEPEGIRREPHDRRRLAPVPLAAAVGAIGVATAGLVAPPVAHIGPGARGILPLGLAEQAITLVRRARQPGYVLLRIAPADIDHRLPAAAPAGIVRALAAATGSDAGVPFRKRHLEASDREHVANLHYEPRVIRGR